MCLRMFSEAAARAATRQAWRSSPILTAEQVLDGRGIDYPGANVSAVKKASTPPAAMKGRQAPAAVRDLRPSGGTYSPDRTPAAPRQDA